MKLGSRQRRACARAAAAATAAVRRRRRLRSALALSAAVPRHGHAGAGQRRRVHRRERHPRWAAAACSSARTASAVAARRRVRHGCSARDGFTYGTAAQGLHDQREQAGSISTSPTSRAGVGGRVSGELGPGSGCELRGKGEGGVLYFPSTHLPNPNSYRSHQLSPENSHPSGSCWMQAALSWPLGHRLAALRKRAEGPN